MNFERLASLPLGVDQHGMEALNGKIYVVAGESIGVTGNHSDKTYEYNPITDAWTEKDDLPIAIQSHVLRAVGDKLYCIGGLYSTTSTYYQDTYEFDPTAAAGSQWTKKADMPTAREDMGSAVFNSKIYVFGGLKAGSTPSNVMEVYNPSANTWDETKDDLPAVKQLGDFGAALNGKIYAIGATNTMNFYPNLTPINTVYEYNPTTDAWSLKTRGMPLPRCYKEVAPMGGKLYVGPGCTSSTTTYTASVYSYNPTTGGWEYEGHTPYEARGVALAALDGEIYLSGGYDGSMRTDFYRMKQTPTPSSGGMNCRTGASGGYLVPRSRIGWPMQQQRS